MADRVPLVATIANMFLWGAATSSLIQINVAFFRTFVATMCCRLVKLLEAGWCGSHVSLSTIV